MMAIIQVITVGYIEPSSLIPAIFDTLAKIKQLFDANVINLTFLFY
jgi:hypothetical protein